MEQIQNNASTTLNGAINDSVTTITVANAGSLPPAEHRIKIDTELMLVTSVSNNDLTVTRGIEGTTPSAHGHGAIVQHVLTAGALDAINSDNVKLDTEPAILRDGQLYFHDNIVQVSHNNAWYNYKSIRPFSTPPSTGWSWLSQDTATVEDTDLGPILKFGGTSTFFRCRVRNIADNSGDFQLTVGLITNLLPVNNTAAGIFFRDSISGRTVTFFTNTNNRGVYVERVTFNGSSWSLQGTEASSLPIVCYFNGLSYFRLKYVSNLTTAQISPDGEHWINIATDISQASAFNGNVPDQLGFGIHKSSFGGNSSVSTWLVHYEEETL